MSLKAVLDLLDFVGDPVLSLGRPLCGVSLYADSCPALSLDRLLPVGPVAANKDIAQSD